MRFRTRCSHWLSFALALLLCAMPALALAQAEGEVLAEGFNGPMGVLLDPDGNVWVIDSGTGGETTIEAVDPNTGQQATAQIGDTARIVKVAPDGTQTDIVTLPSVLIGQEATGGARLALLDGVLYATTGAWLQSAMAEPLPTMAVVIKVADGAVEEVAQSWVLEAARNLDGFVVESHPFGLAAAPAGRLYIVDAGANALLSLNPATGRLGVVTVFPGLPSPLANPNRGGAMETDPVPTGVTLDADGNVYVALLPGFPFVPGSAKVMKISADGATVSDYATGLTSLIDLRTGPDGQLYAVQFATFGEGGPAPESGAIIRVQEGTASEVVLSGLSFPTSLDMNADGDAYVTVNGVGAPGSGAVVRYAAVTTLAGMTMTDTLAMTDSAAMTETTMSEAMTDTMALAGGDAMTETAPAEDAPPDMLPVTGAASTGVGFPLLLVMLVSALLVSGAWLKKK
jgi:hypothetical protein